MQTLTRGLEQGADALLLHSADMLELLSTLFVAARWLDAMTVAHQGKKKGDPDGFYAAKILTGRYFIRAELPRVDTLAAECARTALEILEMPAEAW